MPTDNAIYCSNTISIYLYKLTYTFIFYIKLFIDFEPQYPKDLDIPRIYPSTVGQIMDLSVRAPDQIRIRPAER